MTEPLTNGELAAIEDHAIRRSEELLIQWENGIHDADNLAAAHAYAALALATRYRIDATPALFYDAFNPAAPQ